MNSCIAMEYQGLFVSSKYMDEFISVHRIKRKGRKSVEITEYGSDVKIQQQIAKLLHKYKVRICKYK